jgi:hypothetical protein
LHDDEQRPRDDGALTRITSDIGFAVLLAPLSVLVRVFRALEPVGGPQVVLPLRVVALEQGVALGPKVGLDFHDAQRSEGKVHQRKPGEAGRSPKKRRRSKSEPFQRPPMATDGLLGRHKHRDKTRHTFSILTGAHVGRVNLNVSQFSKFHWF